MLKISGKLPRNKRKDFKKRKREKQNKRTHPLSDNGHNMYITSIN